MADSVFRVEVGVKIGASTTTLKKDIQGILDKMPARTVAIKLDTAQSRQNLKAGLDKLKSSATVPVTLTVNGNGLRGASGKNFRAALKAITSDINAQQAAKITLHIDTKASQKAMLAELKKLDLGVNITPLHNKSGQPRTYVGALREVTQREAAANARLAQSATLDSSSKQFQVLQAQGQRLTQEAQQVRDAYLQTANAQKQGITKQSFDAAVAGNMRVKNSVDKVAASYAKAADTQTKAQAQAQAEAQAKATEAQAKATEAAANKRLEVVRQIADFEAHIVRLRSERGAYTRDTDAYKAYTEQITALRQQESQLKNQYAADNNAVGNQGFYAQLMQEAKALDVVAKATEKARLAAAKRGSASAASSQNLQYEAQKQSVGLNLATEAGLRYQKELDELIEKAQKGSWSLAQFRAALAKWKQEAKDAGAMAETAGAKLSRMLGDKIGYGAIALALMKVRQALSQVYTNVVNLDAAMTELKKVTDETAETYQRFMTDAGDQARALGATMTDVVNATAGFARLGYNLSDSAELAKTAVVYNNVGDEIASIEDATESVISTMQAFNIEAQNSMTIADKFNQIGRRNCPAA